MKTEITPVTPLGKRCIENWVGALRSRGIRKNLNYLSYPPLGAQFARSLWERMSACVSEKRRAFPDKAKMISYNNRTVDGHERRTHSERITAHTDTTRFGMVRDDSPRTSSFASQNAV